MRADNHGEGGILALMSLVTSRTIRARPVERARAGDHGVVRGGADLRRRHHHAGDLGPERARRASTSLTDAFKPYMVPAALVDPAGPVRGAGARHGPHRPGLRADHAAVVRDHRRARAVGRRPASRGRRSPSTRATRIGFLVHQRLAQFRRAGRRVPGDHRRRGALCRHGPLRAQSDPHRPGIAIVLPALLLSYAGQTALADRRSGLRRAIRSSSWRRTGPSFRWWSWRPLATIIASQAIITGAFSLTRQAMQLGWFPGVHIHQTSADEYGQIYVPFVNWAMMVCTLALTCGFGSSERLAGAYGGRRLDHHASHHGACSTTPCATSGAGPCSWRCR